MHICVYGAASATIDPAYIAAGEELGRRMAESRHVLVFGGGGNGLMGAVARGVREGNGTAIAVVPSFFRVDGVLSPYCTEIIYTDTMRERKQKMEELSDAFVMTPGGIGTFDEFFEILTLRSLDRHSVDPVVQQWHDLTDVDAYLCGPPPMVDAAIATLTALGVRENNIFYDKFTTTGEPEA